LETRIEADDHPATAVLQVESVGMALRPVAEHGERFVGEHAEVGVFVSVYFGRHGKIVLRSRSPGFGV